MTGATSRTAIIGSDGELLQVVFSTDGIDMTGATTVDCPDEWPDSLQWDAATQAFVTPPTPPAPPAPALHQLCDMLVTAGTITLAQSDAIKAA